MTRGPVVSEFKVVRRFGEKGQFATTVRLYAGLRRIDIHTKILNNDRFVRYRACFPRRWAKVEASTRYRLAPSSGRRASNRPPRTGSTMATAGTEWPS